jgi:hypothetical protein
MFQNNGNQNNPFLTPAAGAPQAAAPAMVNPFAGTSAADMTQGGQFLPWVNASYTVELGELKIEQSRAGKQLFFISFSILQAPEGAEVAIGGEYQQCINLSNVDTAEGNSKGFFLPAIKALAETKGADPAAVTDEAMKANPAHFDAMMGEGVGPSQPFIGRRLHLTTIPKTTRAGNNFTLHQWQFAPGIQG